MSSVPRQYESWESITQNPLDAQKGATMVVGPDGQPLAISLEPMPGPRFIAPTGLQACALTPILIFALLNSSVNTVNAHIVSTMLSCDQSTLFEWGYDLVANISGGTVGTVRNESIGSATSSVMSFLYGNATTPVNCGPLAVIKTYKISPDNSIPDSINEDWQVLPGYALCLRVTQSIAGNASANVDWREA